MAGRHRGTRAAQAFWVERHALYALANRMQDRTRRAALADQAWKRTLMPGDLLEPLGRVHSRGSKLDALLAAKPIDPVS